MIVNTKSENGNNLLQLPCDEISIGSCNSSLTDHNEAKTQARPADSGSAMLSHSSLLEFSLSKTPNGMERREQDLTLSQSATFQDVENSFFESMLHIQNQFVDTLRSLNEMNTDKLLANQKENIEKLLSIQNEMNEKLMNQEKEFNEKIMSKEREFNEKVMSKERELNEKIMIKEKEFNKKILIKEREFSDKVRNLESEIYEKNLKIALLENQMTLEQKHWTTREKLLKIEMTELREYKEKSEERNYINKF